MKRVFLLGLVVLDSLSVVSANSQSIDHARILPRAADVKESYDYIIVGGGTAGLTVADRLTEDGKHTVLVIEHGLYSNSSSITTIAMGFQGITNASNLFNFTSVPQPELNDRKVTVLLGNVLGGSSAVNGLQFHRGHKEDYDQWGLLFGKRSDWTWEGLLPYFKKAIHFHPPNADTAAALEIKTDASYWGKTSNIHASFPTFNWPSLKSLAAAYRDIPGARYPPDSGAGLPGVYWYPTSADPATMTRSHARAGHYDGLHRDNYHVITESKVVRIIFKGKTATGVAFVPSKATPSSGAKTVIAKKEIIVAAGTIHTPQILQASGVGPKKILESAKVPVVVDLPGVGQNFQDHPLPTSASFTFDNFPFHPDTDDLYTNSTFIQLAQAEFAANRSGPYTIASGNVASFLPLPVIAPERYELIASKFATQDPGAHLPTGSHPTVVAGYGAQKAVMHKTMRSHGSAYYNFFHRGAQQESAIVFLHPTSRGTVNINPADPYFAEPIVDYRALTNPTDIDILIEFTRFTRRYFSVPSLTKLKPRELSPGANVTSDADLTAYIKNAVSPSTFHPVGTAALMPLHYGGVVDEGLLVYGVKKLSVVDASIIPMLPGAYTQQTVYAVAEKAADLIKSRA